MYVHSQAFLREQEINVRAAQRAMLKVLREHDRKECASLFKEPVNATEVPHYYDRISRPIDLKTIGCAFSMAFTKLRIWGRIQPGFY